MFLANPWGLLGLLAVPAILIVHLYHRRFPPLLVGGLHLWGVDSGIRHPGRRRQRLPVTASLLLELLAAILLALILSDPRREETRGVEHLVLVLDNSASMQARTPDGKTFREAAIDEVDRRFARLPKGSVATVIVTGRRPAMLAGPAVELTKARVALDSWRPASTAHDFTIALDLAAQLAESTGQMLFLTDHLPPKELPVPKTMEIVSVGRPMENVAITAARWTFDSTKNKGHVFLRVANFGKRPADVKLRGRKGDRTLFEQSVPLKGGADAAFETDVPGGLGTISAEAVSPGDGLALDNVATLIEPKVRTITIAITLPPKDPAAGPVQRALRGINDIQMGSAADARLIVGPASQLPASRPELWWLGIGPMDPSEPAKKQAKDLVGPFLIEKRHPLLDGVVLGGVVFAGVQPIKLNVTPIVSAGAQPLLCRLNGTQTSAYVLNNDLGRSNLADSPDWPILIKNLVELCRDSLPGLKRWNYRLNEEIVFRIDSPKDSAVATASDTLSLIHEGKSRRLARGSVVEIPPLEETGIYEVRDGERSLGRFAVNFHDPDESTLTSLGPGVRDPVVEVPAFGYRLEDPYSWLIAIGIALIVVMVLADWFVLRPRAARVAGRLRSDSA